MTDAQWYFELMALRRKEKQELDFEIEKFKEQRKMMMQLLGLQLGRFAGDEDEEMFIPLSMLVGQPEVLKAVMEEAQQEEKAHDALDDPEFEEFSKRLASGELSETDLWPGEDEEPLIDFTPRSPQLSFDED